MKVRRKGLATVGAAFALAALVAVIGAAQAAPATKKYSATVHVTNGAVSATNATLTLTLRNHTANQTLGSANFRPPSGVTFPPTGAVVRAADRQGWIASIQDGAVAFRSTSNPLTSGPSDFVSADVQVNIDASICQNATWITRSKQSNDFSGNPGNDFALDPSRSNVKPLGRFTFGPIGTVLGGHFYPQIVVSVGEVVTVTAYDLCGEVKTGYGSTILGNYGDDSIVDRDHGQVPVRLAGAVPLELGGWASGVGSTTLTPLVVEAADRLVVTDVVSGIRANSDAGVLDDFDVVKTICTSTCHVNNSDNNIHVDAEDLPSGASLGVGFSANLLGFSCNAETDLPIGATIIYVNPRGYESDEQQSVTFTYDKTIEGTSGNVENFQLCISKNNGVSWGERPVEDCESDPPVATDPTPCVEDRGRTNGNLFVTIFLDPTVDPAGGMT